MHPVAFALALAVVVYLHVVVGEMVPKNLAIAGPDRAALLLAPPLVWLTRVLGPVIVVLNGLANACLRLLRVEPKAEVTSTFTAEEVSSIVAQSQAEGLLQDEHGLVSGALEFSERTAGDVEVALADVVTLPEASTPAELERLVARTGFSRFPVTGADGELVGYLHLKDVLYADDERYDEPIPAKRVRSLVTVGADDDVEDVLAAMQRSGAHLARVVERRPASRAWCSSRTCSRSWSARCATRRAATGRWPSAWAWSRRRRNLEIVVACVTFPASAPVVIRPRSSKVD